MAFQSWSIFSAKWLSLIPSANSFLILVENNTTNWNSKVNTWGKKKKRQYEKAADYYILAAENSDDDEDIKFYFKEAIQALKNEIFKLKNKG